MSRGGNRPLPTTVMIEARTAADTLYSTISTGWERMHLPAAGGEMTSANLIAGTRGAHNDFLAIEGHLRTFLANIDRWQVRVNYNVQYLENVTFWSENLATQVTAAAENTRRGGQSPNDVAEAIRGTLNHVRDPYNFGVFPELRPNPR